MMCFVGRFDGRMMVQVFNTNSILKVFVVAVELTISRSKFLSSPDKVLPVFFLHYCVL